MDLPTSKKERLQPRRLSHGASIGKKPARRRDAEESDDGVNRSVARALQILLDVAHSPRPQSFVEFQTRLKLPKATLHKLLYTLETLGFLLREKETGRYSIGLKALELSASATARPSDIHSVISPVLRRLVEEHDETGHIGVLDGTEEILLERIDPPCQVVRLAIGRRHPVYGSSGGQAELAARGEAALSELPEKLKPLTKNTIKTRKELLQRLQEIRAKGYALDMEECYPGVRCVGVAIDVPGWPVASISFTLPRQRATVERLRELAKPLLAAKQEIEAILALMPPP